MASAGQKTEPAKDIPRPIVFGPSYPDFQMYTHGRQVFKSRTNEKLFLEGYQFTDEGTFTMGSFLTRLGGCFEKHQNEACPCLIGVDACEVETHLPTARSCGRGASWIGASL